MGAWIETRVVSELKLNKTVAPRVGAWIETDIVYTIIKDIVSRPAWARGLKLLHHYILIKKQ